MHTFQMNAPLYEGLRTELPGDEAAHALKVLRLRPGEEICLLDGAGHRYLGQMGEGAGVTVGSELPNNESAVRVTLYQGFPKGDKLDGVTQKLTELGAAAVVPVMMSRCVVKMNERDGEKRRERLQRIAAEAVKQCRRADTPAVSAPISFRALTERRHELLLVPWEEASGYTLKSACADFPDAKDIALVVGPEGGMSAEEVDMLVERCGARVVTLGPRILRTETAAVAAATMIMTLWGDLA